MTDQDKIEKDLIRDWLIEVAVSDPNPGAVFVEATHDRARAYVTYGELRKLLNMVG
jgi:hypothetical protein